MRISDPHSENQYASFRLLAEKCFHFLTTNQTSFQFEQRHGELNQRIKINELDGLPKF
ncbi:hypothetical protein DsansV1_C14g0128631 [Dioscorea sansibarensis]